MSLGYINTKKIRKSFGKIPTITSLPNLIEVQKRSYDNFLQLKVDPEKREDALRIGTDNIGLLDVMSRGFNCRKIDLLYPTK